MSVLSPDQRKSMLDNMSKEDGGPEINEPVETTVDTSVPVGEAAPETTQVETPAETTPEAPPKAPAPATTEPKATETPAPAAPAADDADKRAEAKAIEMLSNIARQSPENYKAIYGTEPPAGLFKTPEAPAAPKVGESAKAPDPLAALRQELQPVMSYVQMQQRQAALDKLIDHTETCMEKHAVVYNDANFGNLAQSALATMVEKNPTGNVQAMTDFVAGQYKKAIEAAKASYIQGKKAVAARVAPGAGPSGGPIPGKAPEKLVLGGKGPNSTRAALLRSLQEVGEE